jgi:hypothetical protein
MLRSILVAAFAAAAVPALAEEVRLVRPSQAASLATGSVTFSAYFVPLPDASYRVTATWLDAGHVEPIRLSVRLDEGDAISFSLPGHPETRYTLMRDLDAATVRATPVVRLGRTSRRDGARLRNRGRI